MVYQLLIIRFSLIKSFFFMKNLLFNLLIKKFWVWVLVNFFGLFLYVDKNNLKILKSKNLKTEVCRRLRNFLREDKTLFEGLKVICLSLFLAFILENLKKRELEILFFINLLIFFLWATLFLKKKYPGTLTTAFSTFI